eukprot:CAMPEP_0181299336 /NCGR_PEP_ID=MMETSP1101-20121128/6290_1 /TAXON_ID=46948 /ORGANISM="Rhodomonas abbreviata, Strain Caron Lab Isolate" /LENGTH=340 /DNA_ID=CAMNT_0023404475 /DNA_START=296 /DNA_END=1315 /DNA_ORIENTATION=+
MPAPRPIDFSIATGRIGAPQRKGISALPEAQSAEKHRVVLEDGDLRVKVTRPSAGTQELAFPASGTLRSLHARIESIAGSECSRKLLLNGTLLSERNPRLPQELQDDPTLSSLGAAPGSTVLAICTALQDIHDINAADDGLNKFDGRRTFEEEAELERKRALAKPMYARRETGSLQDFAWGFAAIEPLHQDPNTGQRYSTPPPADATRLLQALASDKGIEAVMKKYQWRVGLLTEIPPSLETGLMGVSDHCLLGLNVNKGQEIKLRLRTSDLLGFRKYLSIKETLIHELTHMVHSEHDNKFWSFFRVLMKEAEDLDWTKSNGHALAGDDVSRGGRGGAEE